MLRAVSQSTNLPVGDITVTGNLSVSGNETITGNLSVTGTITPGQTTGIVGTTTNNNAQAGSVGEYISSSIAAGDAVAITTGNAANVTSITLTAGDWDVTGNVLFSPNAATTITYLQAGIGTTSATFPTVPAAGGTTFLQYSSAITGVGQGLSAGTVRVLVAANTPVYLLAVSNFATNTNAAYGFIGARRRR